MGGLAVTPLVTLPVSGVVRGGQLVGRGGALAVRGIRAGGGKVIGGVRDGVRGAVGLGDDALGLVEL